jgi:catechol 2,3-dioxygenase-like lactoylglutathione lyase family enzyme
MPTITDRSSASPILKTGILNHGTLHCNDIAKTRRFYEEVLGLDVIQTSPMSLMVRKGTSHVYAVLEVPRDDAGMHMLNHNGFEVDSAEEVEAAYQKLLEVQDEYEIKKVMKPNTLHGDRCFYFCDLDGNWWEIVAVRQGGYVADFDDEYWDLTGRHGVEEKIQTLGISKKLIHTHNREFRAAIAESDD